MERIISLPNDDNDDSTEYEATYKFGFYETMNFPYRDSQEDALTWHVLTPAQLTATDSSEPLTPIEIGHRLWTSYQVLDDSSISGGTTASTTVYDGKGNLITATLADAVTFAAFYDLAGDVLGVVRLNSVTHKPTNPEELLRIQAAGGNVWFGRVEGSLAVSRAIGDSRLKNAGVCSEAQIDITDINTLMTYLNLKPERVKTMQIITTCDGFTDGAGANFQSKRDHEEYLYETLQTIPGPGMMREDNLSAQLVKKAIKDRSRDNVSIAIQTVNTKTPPFLLGLFDGHGGKNMACHAASNIGQVFKDQCVLSTDAYARQLLSVNRKTAEYIRDNSVIDSPEVYHEPIEMVTESPKESSQIYAAFFQPETDSEEKKQAAPIFSNIFGNS